jgi:plastocyanin
LPPVLILASTDINAFHVIGGILAVWAVVISALGVTRKGFPAGGAEKLVIAVTALLVVGTLSAAVITSSSEEAAHAEGGEVSEEPTKAGPEGTQEETGTPAPDTAQEGEEAEQPAPTPTSQTLELATEPSGELAYDKAELEAETGNVTIEASNPSPVPHNVAIEGGGVDEQGPVVQEGGTSRVSVDLEPGEYTFYCSVPGHREGGMEGTLTVK